VDRKRGGVGLRGNWWREASTSWLGGVNTSLGTQLGFEKRKGRVPERRMRAPLGKSLLPIRQDRRLCRGTAHQGKTRSQNRKVHKKRYQLRAKFCTGKELEHKESPCGKRIGRERGGIVKTTLGQTGIKGGDLVPSPTKTVGEKNFMG